MKYLVMAFLLVSCAKSVDHSPIVHKNSNVLSSSFLVRNLDSTVLSITLEPNVVCYSYKDTATSKPCDIFVFATVHLSRPLASELHIELNRENVGDNAQVVLVMAPNTTSAELNTGFSNHDNQDVPDNVRIGKITFVPVIH